MKGLCWLLVTVVWISSLAIDPSRLLVATIIDPNVDRIVRDSKLLFQSIRFFGGTLNNATLLACIIVDKEGPFNNDNLIKFYLEIGVVIDFVSRVPTPLPGTMNKFSAFYRFDTTRYDYFLWIDADIVVFQDPIPLLREKYRKGTIACVAEMYNYMIRFPLLNESNLFWNPSLPRFILADDVLVAPHGHCNTGVLLLDSRSLPLFLNTLHHQYLQEVMMIYTTDRFLDSLCFVGIVNLAKIEVELLDHALNYMAFLEQDIARLELTSYDPILAHFIANSTLECYLPQNEVKLSHCTCLYVNDEFVSNDSKIVKKIKELLLPLDHCLVFAGVTPLPKKYFSHNIHDSSFSSAISIVSDSCHLSLLFPHQEMIIFYDLDVISVSIILDAHLEECSQLLKMPISIQDESSHRLLHIGHLNITGSSPQSFIVQFFIPREIQSHNGQNIAKLTLSNQTIKLIFVSRSKIVDSFRMYSLNYLVSQIPIILYSQVLLPRYLVLRRLTKRGMVLCCETRKGVHVVENLISSWGKDYHDGSQGFIDTDSMLIIIISAGPQMTDFANSEMLVTHLTRLCQSSTKARCVVSLRMNYQLFTRYGSLSSSSLYRNQFFDFIYIDISDSSATLIENLFDWYSALVTGGILLGSRYGHSDLLHNYYETYRNHIEYQKLLIQSAVVDNFGFLQKISPLHTSSENDYLMNQSDPFSSLPAWYFIKQERFGDKL